MIDRLFILTEDDKIAKLEHADVETRNEHGVIDISGTLYFVPDGIDKTTMLSNKWFNIYLNNNLIFSRCKIYCTNPFRFMAMGE